MKTNLLNDIAALLIANGIAPTKETVISMAILAMADMGVPITEATKLVLGEDVIDGIYHSLRA